MMKERLRGFDPFRMVMMATPDRRITLALMAVLCVAFYAAVRVLCGAMEGVTVIAAVGALCVASLLWGMAGTLRREKSPVVVLLLAALLAMLAVGAHRAMLE